MLRRALHPSASLISRASSLPRSSQRLFASTTPIIPINLCWHQLAPLLEITDLPTYRKRNPGIPLDALQAKVEDLHGWPFYKLKKPRAMILTLDGSGTLADKYGLAVLITLTELFNNHGLHVTPDQIRKDMGINKRPHIESIGEMIQEQLARKPGWEKFTDSHVDQLHEAFQPLMISNLKKYGSLVPGMRKTLCDIAAVEPMELATNSGFNRPELNVLIDEAHKEVDGRSVPLGFSVTGSEACSRPAPDMHYLTIADYARRWHILLDPISLVAVGDTKKDRDSAINAGAWSVIQAGYSIDLKINSIKESEDRKLVAAGRQQLWQHHLEENRADYVIMDPGDLDVVIPHINRRLADGEIPRDRPTYGVLYGKIYSLHENSRYHLNFR